MNNEIIISNIAPQDIIIEGGGSTIGLTAVYVNGVNVTVGSVAYVIVPTKLSELKNNVGYITSETDPTVPTYIKQITMSDITSWNNKQNLLVSGTNIKTINNNSILGSGNLDISTSYTAGTGIEITEENVINNTITSYNDLTDRPTIPTHTSDLINDSNFVNGNSLSQVAYTGDYYDLIGKPDLSEYITKYVDNLVNYYTKDFMYDLLPKVSDEDTSITLNDTYPSDLKISLNPSELEQDGTPTPDSPQDIHTISGSNKVVVCGNNIFDIEGWFTNIGASYTKNNDESYTLFNQQKLYSQPYIFSNTNINVSLSGIVDNGTSSNVRVQLLNSNDEMVGEITSSSNSTLNKSACKIRLNWSTSGEFTLKNIMLNKGTTVLPYTPYVSQTANINLGDIEYCKIGNYEDRIFKNVSGDVDYSSEREDGAWYIKKNIGKVVLDGSENFNKSYNTSADIFNYKLNNGDTNGTTETKSNYFKYAYENVVGSCRKYNDYIYLVPTTYGNLTIEQFKTWLSTHNTEVYYPLATPTYTPITGTLAEQLEYIYNQMLAYKGQTSISQLNNDLPFIISATTLKDISSL